MQLTGLVGQLGAPQDKTDLRAVAVGQNDLVSEGDKISDQSAYLST